MMSPIASRRSQLAAAEPPSPSPVPDASPMTSAALPSPVPVPDVDEDEEEEEADVALGRAVDAAEWEAVSGGAGELGRTLQRLGGAVAAAALPLPLNLTPPESEASRPRTAHTSVPESTLGVGQLPRRPATSQVPGRPTVG